MKIMGREIIGGPNWQFYFATIGIIYLSIITNSIWPVLGWVLFWIILTPACIKLHEWNEREDAKMLQEFPFDKKIQAKYAKKANGEK